MPDLSPPPSRLSLYALDERHGISRISYEKIINTPVFQGHVVYEGIEEVRKGTVCHLYCMDYDSYIKKTRTIVLQQVPGW